MSEKSKYIVEDRDALDRGHEFECREGFLEFQYQNYRDIYQRAWNRLKGVENLNDLSHKELYEVFHYLHRFGKNAHFRFDRFKWRSALDMARKNDSSLPQEDPISTTNDLLSYDAMLRSVFHGDCERVRELLNSGTSPNAHLHGFTALMMACEWSQKEIVELLLFYGADPSLYNTKGERAVDLCSDPEIRKLLFKGSEA